MSTITIMVFIFAMLTQPLTTSAWARTYSGHVGVLKFAKTIAMSATDYARINAAVKNEWGAMDRILHVKLKKDVYGFWGQAANQLNPTGEKDPKRLVGRIYQLWIPNLTDQEIERVSMQTPEDVPRALKVN